jgi:hypothetical protein
MRAVVCLVVAALWAIVSPATVFPAMAQPADTAAFWKNVQTRCDATAAMPAGETGQRVAKVALDEFHRFDGHRIDADGRLVGFGQTEAEQSLRPTAQMQSKVGNLAWWRVMQYWQALFGKDAPSKLEVLGFGDAVAASDADSEAPLIRTTTARLLQAAENESDPETREVLREAAWRLAIIDTPWSAAFVSYVVRKAGATDKTFRFSNAHWGYIYDAFATSKAEADSKDGGKADAHLYRACPLETTVPRPGDIVCRQRDRKLEGATDRAVRDRIVGELAGGPLGYTVRATHCEVVAFIDAPARKLYTISGNVEQAVTARKLNLRADMKFSAAQGRCEGASHWTLPSPQAAEGAPVSHGNCSLNDKNWFVLLQVRTGKDAP